MKPHILILFILIFLRSSIYGQINDNDYHVELNEKERIKLCNSSLRFESSIVEKEKVPNYVILMMRVFKIDYKKIGLKKSKQILKHLIENETEMVWCWFHSAKESGKANFFSQYLIREAQAFTICYLTLYVKVDWNNVKDKKGKKLFYYLKKYSKVKDYNEQIAEVLACLKNKNNRYYPKKEEWEDLK